MFVCLFVWLVGWLVGWFFCLFVCLFVFSLYDDEVESGWVQKELCVLRGMVEHLLPRVGSHVQTLDLSHGKAISNEVVRDEVQ